MLWRKAIQGLGSSSPWANYNRIAKRPRPLLDLEGGLGESAVRCGGVRTALGLSDEQANRLRQVMGEAQKSALKTRADLGVRRIELRELMRADQPDRDAVMKKVQEVSDLRGQMMKQRVESLLASKAILTPEQQQKIRAFMHRRGQEGFRGREGFRGPGSFDRRLPRGPMAPGGPPAPPPPGESSDQ